MHSIIWVSEMNSFFCRYGPPDPNLVRDCDISVKLQMASVRYIHTNRFQMEFVAFLQHFLQLQDVLGRYRAASAGKRVKLIILDTWDFSWEKGKTSACITLDQQGRE